MSYLRHIWKWSLFLSLLPTQLMAQCSDLSQRLDTLAYEDFEGSILTDWEAPITSLGGEWQHDEAPIGYYRNPGTGKWLYVNDEIHNDIGKAEILSPAWDPFPYKGYLFMEVDLLFQAFEDSGSAKVEIWDGGQWVLLYETHEDFAGRLQFDLSALQTHTLQLRFVYDDEGSWGWGMGIDNFVVYGKVNSCGNGICEAGESPSSCPGDCPSLTAPAPYWVPNGKNLQGQTVAYRPLRGGTPCDDCSEAVELGFSFDFYGRGYHQLFINSNGHVTLGSDYVAYTPDPFCLNGPHMLAPFFADADLVAGGEVNYFLDPDAHYLIVNWLDVGYYGCGGNCSLRNTFQLIITDGSIRQIGKEAVPHGANAIFNYGDMQWTAGNSSGGLAGFFGSAATVGLNQGNGVQCHDYGLFDEDSYRYLGNNQDDACPPNGVSHLDYRSLLLNAAEGRLQSESEDLPPVVLTGNQEGNNLLIQWSWPDSPTGLGQVIQGSKDSSQYQNLTYIDPTQGQQGEDGSWQFVFVDENPTIGTNWYRLQIDLADGSTRYSEVLAVLFRPIPNPVQILSYGPNPLETQLHLSLKLPDLQVVSYRLSDMRGTPLLEDQEHPVATEHRMTIDIPHLPAGNYILTLYHPLGHAAVQLVKY